MNRQRQQTYVTAQCLLQGNKEGQILVNPGSGRAKRNLFYVVPKPNMLSVLCGFLGRRALPSLL